MSMDFEDGSNQWVTFPTNGDITQKMSCSFWVNAESNPGAHQAIFVSKNIIGLDRPAFRFLWTPAGGGDVYTVSYAGGGFNEWKADYSPTLATWEHWYFQIDWTVNPDTHEFWVNNVAKTMTHNFGSNNITPDVTATQQFVIGGNPTGDANHADGKLAEVGVWNKHRTAEERALLAAGYSPDHFTDGLMHYVDGRNGFRDLVNGAAGTLNNTPVISTNHPPKMVYLSSSNNFRSAKAGDGISVAERVM